MFLNENPNKGSTPLNRTKNRVDKGNSMARQLLIHIQTNNLFVKSFVVLALLFFISSVAFA